MLALKLPERLERPERRRLCGAALAGAALSFAGPLRAAAAAAPFQRPLPLPALLEGSARADGTLTYGLRMAAGATELLPGLRTPSWGYNGAWLGPALRVPRGRPVRITLANGLDQATTTHWHGAHVPGVQDGGPQSLIEPGATREYALTLDQPGATLWYHPHPDGLTGAHVWAGLAGLLLVDDGVDRALGLPSTWGADDFPLVLQDRRLDAQGRLLYLDRPRDRIGMKGDVFLVNGCAGPYLQVPAQRVRLRVLNGSNARFYNLAFADNRPFHAIATDAGLLAAPVELRSLLLAPGERAEIVVDFGADRGRTLMLRSDSGAIVPELATMSAVADDFDRHGFDLLQLRVAAPLARAGRLPDRLAELPPLQLDGAGTRLFTLQNMAAGMGAMAGMGHVTGRGPGGMSLGDGGAKLFSINDRFMDMAVIDQRVALGATEVWTIRNDADMAHPLHMHGTSFRIVDRNGRPPRPHERGWKDVVLVRQHETVRVAARFAQPADASHPFMYHCHVLEHEDNGMMGQFTVG